MPDEVVPEAPIPEAAPIEAPIPSPEPIPEPIPPQAEPPVPPEPPTAQIPANEPIAPQPEPLPQPAPQAQVHAPVFAPITNFARDLAVKARAVIQGRRRKKLEKILEAVTKHGSITNDQVEKLLHVSDATATRYLTQLEKEGKVRQEGKTGKSVKYLKS
jgi:colicin import membrane protein